ncbi:MAG: hypothetical protein MUO53_01005 [Maribacter sp.]|nr:hypothetical protein [Maribacter sp.]
MIKKTFTGIVFIIGLFLLLSVSINFIKSTVIFKEEANRGKDAYLSFNVSPFLQGFQDNNSPKVNILSPKNNGFYKFSTSIPYAVSVSDAEDGESMYNEIPSDEVLLKVEYVSRVTLNAKKFQQEPEDDLGLLDMAASNCLYCHAFKGNLIGPSLHQISELYNRTKPDMGMISSRIKNGSSGYWNNNVMPSHPELTDQEIELMVMWIIQNASQKDVNYYKGTEGTLELHPDTQYDIKDRIFVISAKYRDHGSKGDSKKIGEDHIVINPEE